MALVSTVLLAQFSYCQVKTETSQEVNERIRQLAALDQAKPGNTVIGAGDVLHIDVFDVPDLSRDVRIDQSREFTLPLVPGKIEAAGFTPYQLQERIARLLQSNGLVTNPQVSVFVKEQYSEPVSIIGAVNHPQVIQLVRPMTLLELIANAGGIADDAGAMILVIRQNAAKEAPAAGNSDSDLGAQEDTAPASLKPASATLPSSQTPGTQESKTTTTKQDEDVQTSPNSLGGETIQIRLRDLLDSGDPSFNIPILGGDVISVPRSGIVYVAGAVQSPGGYVLQGRGEQVTTAKLIALAHGWTSTAKPNKAVIVRTDTSTGKKEEIPVKLKAILQRKTADVRLFPNDLLIIPDSTGKKVLYQGLQSSIGIGTGVATYRAIY